MSDNDTRAALDAAMDTWGAAEIHAASGGFERADVEAATAKRAILDRAIAAHVAAEVARAVSEAHAEADQLNSFANEVICRVGARERGAGGQTTEAGTVRLLADAARRIDALIARDRARPTPDEARRLVDAYGSAVDRLAGLGDIDRPSMDFVEALRRKHDAARTALLRALGVESGS